MKPFRTKWFNFEENYIPGMLVFDLDKNLFTADGQSWEEIAIDHL